jgi:alpha-beta hydrolase superfamily lysophospholipase
VRKAAELSVARAATVSSAQPPPCLYFFHGIMESAETVTVQRLAAHASTSGWRLVVLEHEGHGLSSGPRGVCGDIERLVRHATEFVHASQCEGPGRFALCGHSAGATVAMYAADALACTEELRTGSHLLGAALVAPAVGANPDMVPRALVVAALRVVAWVAPNARPPVTPIEDPSHYAMPPDSTRNFAGRWPLATARMLLDLGPQVASDRANGRLVLDFPLLVVAGKGDRVVPLAAVEAVFAGTPGSVEMLCVRGGHQMVAEKGGNEVVAQVFEWLARFLSGAVISGTQQANGTGATATATR